MTLEHAEQPTSDHKESNEARKIYSQPSQWDSRNKAVIRVIGDYIAFRQLVNLRIFIHSHLSLGSI